MTLLVEVLQPRLVIRFVGTMIKSMLDGLSLVIIV